MKKTYKLAALNLAAILVVGAMLAGQAKASEPALVLEPTVSLRALGAAPVEQSPKKPELQIRSASLEEAEILMKSTATKGQWDILQVQGPACEINKGKHCKTLRAVCAKSVKFAKKYKKHANCSALYTQANVLLVPTGVRMK